MTHPHENEVKSQVIHKFHKYFVNTDPVVLETKPYSARTGKFQIISNEDTLLITSFLEFYNELISLRIQDHFLLYTQFILHYTNFSV